MAMSTQKLRPILSSVLGLTLGGLALTLLGVAGGPAPAAAFGGFGFGHMGGGFGGPGMGMGRGLRGPMMTPRRGGTYVARPPGGTRGNPGNGGDGNRWPPHHPVTGIRSSFRFRAAARRHPISRRRWVRPASTAVALVEAESLVPAAGAERAAECRRAASGASCLMK
jgi:hypothetical protein